MVHKMQWYIGTEWASERRGLMKKVLDLNFQQLAKPHQVSKVVINVDEIRNLKNRESVYLAENTLGEDQVMEMGTALCPVDYYMEILVQQMIEGEKASCRIKTKTSEEIVVVLTLKKILDSQEIQKLTALQMYDLALKYKENGVKMYKNYGTFAHEYFARAAKCLLSYRHCKDLTKQNDGIDAKGMQELLVLIQTNLAACVLAKNRNEDVIYHTNFINDLTNPSEKAVYRRAMAYYNMQEFELAIQTIENVENYNDKIEFSSLYQKVKKAWSKSREQYKGMVQKMFS